MNRILIVAEHAGGKLNAAVAKCVSCAASMPDAEIAIAVLAAGRGRRRAGGGRNRGRRTRAARGSSRE